MVLDIPEDIMSPKRKYEQTHPWLNFKPDLGSAPASLWMLLGEARSKCEHIAGTPLKPGLAKQFHSIYLAKGVRATTAIEGNTLTEDEVRRQIEGKLTVPPSKEYLKQEVANIIDACNLISRQVLKKGREPLTPSDILKYHGLILRDINCESHVTPGKIRTASVGVGAYRAVPAEDCEFLLENLCKWLNENDRMPSLDDISYGILRAIIAHLYIAWIHPFGDGNGRLARLLEFRLMIEAGIPTPACHLLSDHYNNTRAEYYRQLDAAGNSKGRIVSFIIYALQGLVDGLQEQIDRIRLQHYNVSWNDYVYEVMNEYGADVGKRRRNLVLELSKQSEPIDIHNMLYFTPAVAELYKKKTMKTLKRDLAFLLKHKLIRVEEGKCVANKEIISAFLPQRSKHESKVTNPN